MMKSLGMVLIGAAAIAFLVPRLHEAEAGAIPEHNFDEVGLPDTYAFSV